MTGGSRRKEIVYIAFTKIIDQIFTTFPDTPFIYVGTDEASGFNTLSANQDPSFFILHPDVPKNSAQALLNFFMFRANNYIRSSGKRMITWENGNSSASYANTNNTIIRKNLFNCFMIE
jgi:N-acetyl-beta-hexosaminidase